MLETITAVFQVLKFLFIVLPFITIMLLFTKLDFSYVASWFSNMAMLGIGAFVMVIFFSILDIVDF
jgi:hypothetical protein